MFSDNFKFGTLTKGIKYDIHVLSYDFYFQLNYDIHADFLVCLEQNLKQAEISYIPQTLTEVTDEEAIKNLNKLIDMLEDNDDVQNVYHTWDMPEDEEEE